MSHIVISYSLVRFNNRRSSIRNFFFIRLDFSLQTSISAPETRLDLLHDTKPRRRHRRASSSCDPDRVVPLVAYVGQEVELQCRRWYEFYRCL